MNPHTCLVVASVLGGADHYARMCRIAVLDSVGCLKLNPSQVSAEFGFVLQKLLHKIGIYVASSAPLKMSSIRLNKS
jgi:hypothetical protein